MQTQKIFKRIYLHIGLGKTGTSSIQQELCQNTDLLAREYGIHYPCDLDNSARFDGNHSRYLSAMFPNESAPTRSVILAGLQSPQELAAHAAKIKAGFERGFAATRADRLLISAEGVGHFATPRVLKLAGWLRQFSQEIEIVACVRHPVEVLSSEIQQRLRQGFILEDLYAQPPHYNFEKLFSRMQKGFPNSRITAYSFAEAVQDAGGLASALLQKIGIDTDLPAFVPVHLNPSMSHEAALLLSALNRARPLVVDDKRSRLRSASDISAFLKIPGRKYQAPREVCDRLARQAADDLIWLKENYGIELALRPVASELDHNYFSPQSIEYIALGIARRAAVHDAIASPLRPAVWRLRAFSDRIRRKFK